MTAMLADMNLDTVLADGIRSLGLSLPADARAKLRRYVELLAKWNRTYNLTAIREPAQMVTHHLLDSLAALPHLPHGGRLLDVGTGAGLPSIPLAIAQPKREIVAIDSNQKKVSFVTQAAIELSLVNLRAIAARVEELEEASQFDLIITRAFADLRTFFELSAKHLAPNGRLYAMKGVIPDEEIAALPANAEVVATISLQVPALDAARHLIVMRPRASVV
jgi:16S rRNA (guanine527-N7)-methyltransferase